MGENLWLRAKTEANVKPELKMKVVCNTCYKELGGKMKPVNVKFFKSSLENFQTSLNFKETLCEVYREKQYTDIVYNWYSAFFTNFL